MPVAAMFCLVMSVTRGWLGPIREMEARARPNSNLNSTSKDILNITYKRRVNLSGKRGNIPPALR